MPQVAFTVYMHNYPNVSPNNSVYFYHVYIYSCTPLGARWLHNIQISWEKANEKNSCNVLYDGSPGSRVPANDGGPGHGNPAIGVVIAAALGSAVVGALADHALSTPRYIMVETTQYVLSSPYYLLSTPVVTTKSARVVTYKFPLYYAATPIIYYITPTMVHAVMTVICSALPTVMVASK